MSKKICSDYKAVAKKMDGQKAMYYCKKCGKHVSKDKWACKPVKI